MKKGLYLFLIIFSLAACQKKDDSKGGTTTGGEPNDPVNPAPSAFVYTENVLIYNKGTSINSLRPSYFGSPNNFSISPVLPSGLTFNTNTGEISGTPTQETPATNYTIIASNSFGSDDATISIEIRWSLPLLLKDNLSIGGSGILNPVEVVNEKIFFGSNENGGELWVSEGNSLSTRIIKTFSSTNTFSSPRLLTKHDNNLYFIAHQDNTGAELWKSDGTTDGTILVKDILSGGGDSQISELTSVGNTLFFIANNGINGFELWKSDGTSSGTVMVKDISPSSTTISPSNLTKVNTKLFFTTNDELNGEELWVSDGTTGGTFMVSDLSSGSGDSQPRLLTAVGSEVYFKADDATGLGSELYKSDGVSISLVSDIIAGPVGSSIENLSSFDDGVVFSSFSSSEGRELFFSDGLNTNLLSIENGSYSSNPYLFTKFNNKLFFVAQTPSTGYELFHMDENLNPTLFSDVSTGVRSSFPNSLVVVNNLMFFIANTEFEGNELWRTDGINAPIMVKDLTPGGISSELFFIKRRTVGTSEGLFFFQRKLDGKYKLFLMTP